MFKFFRRSHASAAPWVTATAISTIFGCAAGAVGTLLVVAFVAPEYVAVPVTPASPRAPIGTSDEAVSAAGAEAASRGIAYFAPAKADAALPAGVYVPGEAVGLATVLTSDGWMVTHAAALATRAKRPLEAAIGGRAYDLGKESVKDVYTGAVFVKIDATNLPVVPFGDTESLAPGDAVFGVDAAGGVVRLTVASRDAAPSVTTDDAVRSSDRLQQHLRVTGATLLPGAAVMNRRGEVIGIAASSGPFGVLVVPMEDVSAVIGAVLKNGKVERPSLGLSYLDLAKVAVPGAVTTRGAYVSGGGGVPAVIAGGPAAKGGLRAGDTVIAVNGEPVSAKNGLANIIADYLPGDTLTLSVLRGRASEIPFVVTLGTAVVQ